MNTQDEISQLHAEYLRLVGGELSLTLDRMYWWGQWKFKGWGINELQTVIGHIQSQIKKGHRYPGALRWSRLIQQADNFEEELNLARAERRQLKPKQTPKERVLSQCRPVAVESARSENTARPIGEWIAELRRSVA